MKNFIDIEDEAQLKKVRKLINMYSKKFHSLDDETLLILREELNYILEVRSQAYMDQNEV